MKKPSTKFRESITEDGWSRFERDPESDSFHADVSGLGIEVSAPFPSHEGEPEILEIARRLESTLRRREAEIAKMPATAALAASEPEKDRAELLSQNQTLI